MKTESEDQPMSKRTTVLCLLTLLAVSFLAACASMSDEELKNAFEVLNVQTKWVTKYYQPWPARLIMVPQVSFQVRNKTDKLLTYINFNAIFQFKGEQQNFGDCYLAAIRGDGVPPGGTSETIVLKSNYGVDGRDLANVRANLEQKPADVRLFAQSKGSKMVLLGVWDLSLDLDYKEPGPVEIKDTGEKK
jgi:hypothetical protein